MLTFRAVVGVPPYETYNCHEFSTANSIVTPSENKTNYSNVKTLRNLEMKRKLPETEYCSKKMKSSFNENNPKFIQDCM